MPNPIAPPRQIGTTVLVLLALVLAVVALPASALAAPEEGAGTVSTSPEPIVLPATTVNNQSPFQTVHVSYEGEGEASVNKVTIEGEESGEFFLNGSNCGNLASVQQCDVWLGLKPGTTGEKHAWLTITFNGTRPEQKFEISGRGVPASLAFTPSSHDFGLQRVNRESVSTTFQLQNTGEAEVQLGNLEFTGPGAGVFWTGNVSCWGTWLAPGQSCSVQVWFNPQETVSYEAELRAQANGSVASAELLGEGGRAIVQATENPVDFGVASAGSSGSVHTITLENTGNLPESFFIGVIAGGDAGSFQLLDEHCTMIALAPGASCTAHVRFQPLAPGSLSAHLAFFGDGEGGVLVQLEGEGVLGTGSIAPGSFDFGTQAVGSKSIAHVFTVSNSGTAPLGFDRVSLGGTELDQFVISGDECSGASLASGEKCEVHVRFAPDSPGAKQATLRVSGDAPTVVAALSGTGSAVPGPATAAVTSPIDTATTAAPGPPPPPGRPRGRRHRRFVRSYDVPTSGTQQARRGGHRRH
jgi:hypothetical protein